MGLDSVELVMEWERYFEIEIPNPVAEKINTVQDAVEAICTIKGISAETDELRERMFLKLQAAMLKVGLCTAPIHISDLVSPVLTAHDQVAWASLAEALGLDIPLPPKKAESGSLKTKLIKIISWEPRFNYAELTFSDLTDVICASTLHDLIESKIITTKYEVYLVLMAITVDKIGIDVYEFKTHKTFTGDFGID